MARPTEKQNPKTPTMPNKPRPPKPGPGREWEEDTDDIIEPRNPRPGAPPDDSDVTDKPRPDQEDTRYKPGRHGDRTRPVDPEAERYDEGWVG
jgi:hypothetical protein